MRIMPYQQERLDITYSRFLFNRGDDEHMLSPYIRAAMDYTTPPEWRLEWRVIFDYELFYIKRGRIRLYVEDEIYVGGPGDVFLIHPNQRHSIEIIGPALFQHPHIHFDAVEDPLSPRIPVNYLDRDELPSGNPAYFREDLLAGPPYNLGTKLELHDPLIVEKKIQDLIGLFEKRSIEADIESKGVLICLIANIMSQLRLRNLAADTHITALRTGEEILHDVTRNDTIEEIASTCGYSRSHFIKEFTNAYGMTPHQYRISVRITRAKTLLRNSKLPISIIYDLSGYKSLIAFSTAFKNHVGKSPTAYRDKFLLGK